MVKDENLDIGPDDESDYRIEDFFYNNDGQGCYILQNMNNPYKHPFRIKSFLTSFCRTDIAKVARVRIDNVLRIHTDGICFTEPFKNKVTNFIPPLDYSSFQCTIEKNNRKKSRHHKMLKLS
jgi:hypothetical protein